MSAAKTKRKLRKLKARVAALEGEARASIYVIDGDVVDAQAMYRQIAAEFQGELWDDEPDPLMRPKPVRRAHTSYSYGSYL